MFLYLDYSRYNYFSKPRGCYVASFPGLVNRRAASLRTGLDLERPYDRPFGH